jgi:uncharacterized protein (UPF0276 family)
MRFAVNYSLPIVHLLRQQQIEIDYLKCPAWLDLAAEAQSIHPVYVHFPLRVGRGIGDAIDSETGQRADWNKVESLLKLTGTRFVNIHLDSLREDYPSIPFDTINPAEIELLTEQMIHDVRAVVERFGADRVIAENDNDIGGRMVRPALLPSVICRVIEEAGCGFLLDLSHARLSAPVVEMDVREYIAALPVKRIREIHVTGVQQLEGHWLDATRQTDRDFAERFAGQWIDHLPMTEVDWEFFAWAMRQIHSGAWAQPQIVAFEYGGLGGFFGALTDTEILATQVPRLCAMIKQEEYQP